MFSSEKILMSPGSTERVACYEFVRCQFYGDDSLSNY